MTAGVRGSGVGLFAAAVLMLSPLASGQTLPPQQPPPVFRTGADIVSVDVSVQRDRRPVSGLRAADFELIDNGVAQEITEIAYETLPIDVTLLLDVSASVTGQALDELRDALRQVRSDMRAGDRMRLLTFNMRVRRLVDFDQPASGIDKALASLRGAGSSAVFDSLAVALTTADAPGRRRLIVLLSDGQDSSSITDAGTLVDIARRSSQTVAVILSSSTAALRTRPSSQPAAEGAVPERVAAETGGVVTAVEPGENLSSRFRRTLQEFRSSYVLYFTPRGVEPSGAHTLDVRVKRDGVEVRARRGYVWR